MNIKTKNSSFSTHHPDGYTLIELMVVITIMTVLISVVATASWQHLRNKAEAYTCQQNMRSLYVALDAYRGDHEGGWPQMTEEEFENLADKEEDMWKWWYERLKKYSISPKNFLCPTDDRERNSVATKEDPREEYESSYIFPLFDAGAETPTAWAMPWILERSNFHGEGNYEMMPDGQIRPSPFWR